MVEDRAVGERQRGRVALVAGGGTGIGRAIARRLAAEGAAVVVAGRRPEPLREVVKVIESAGGRALGLPADIREADHCRRVVEGAVGHFGRLDMLVASAGRTSRNPLVRTPEDDIHDVLATNLRGILNIVRAAVPALANAQPGQIVFISSVAAHAGYGYPVYGATKAGLVSLARDLARELGPLQITVNAVSPGVIETPLNQHIFADPTMRQAVVRLTPRGRLGQLGDVAGSVAFLVSPDADFITGQELTVDGGMSRTVYWGEVAERLGIGPLAETDLHGKPASDD